MGVRLEGAPAVPPRFGLVAQANRIEMPDNEWALYGFSYLPENCGEAGVFDVCASATKTIADRNEQIDYQPFGVYAGDRCSAFGYQAGDFRGRAERQLRAAESKQLEAEFWKGTLADANNWPNRYLASPASDVLSPDGDGVSPTHALACLEQGLSDCSTGRGMIHATSQIVTLWMALQLLMRDGNQIVTIKGTIVIPGDGYDGSGPNGEPAADGAIWAYATDEVTVRRGAISIVPDGDDLTQALRRSNNDVEVIAERPVAATWDTCCHLAVQIEEDVCGIGGS